jgi:hypothetical protein
MNTKMKSMSTKLLLIILVSSSSIYVNSQITYIDIDPDTTISENGGYYNIDVNGDDSAEFQIIRQSSPTNNESVDINILKENCYVAGIIGDCAFAVEYHLNDSIGPESWWHLYYNHFLMAFIGASVCLSSGQFIGDTNVYLGLKWIETGITHYGWFRVDVADDATWFTVKDYAYSSSTILAGQKSSTYLDEFEESDLFQIFNNDIRISVKPKEETSISDVHLLNMLSQEVPSKYTNSEVVIDKQMIPPGLYLLYLKTNKVVHILKILIK